MLSLSRGFINNLVVRNLVAIPISINRTTFIVKRKYPPPLSRVNAKHLRKLKGKHFIYELVEDTNLREPPDLHIVLTTFVEGIGDVGDVISIMAQYARQHLLLPGKAAYATSDNIEKYERMKETRPERPKFSSIHSGITMKCLSESVIPILMNLQVPWVLQKNHVQIGFRMEGFSVPQDAIELPVSAIDGPDLTKDGKDLAVYITINNMERFPVRCRLFHLTPGMETSKLPEDCYLQKSDPILPEQSQLLEEMPTPKLNNDPSANISLIEKYCIQFIK